MRTMLTALATTLMFFSGTLCEGLAFNLESESLVLPVEESEFDSRLKYPLSERGGGAAGIRVTASRAGNRTFEELRAKRRFTAARVRRGGSRASETGRMPFAEGNNSQNVNKKVVRDSGNQDDRNAVIINHDLEVVRILAVTAGSPEDSGSLCSQYRITVDVHNKGDRGAVLVILSGKGLDGREIVSFTLKEDVLDGKETKTLAASVSLTSLKSCEIQSWEVFRAYKFNSPA